VARAKNGQPRLTVKRQEELQKLLLGVLFSGAIRVESNAFLGADSHD